MPLVAFYLVFNRSREHCAAAVNVFVSAVMITGKIFLTGYDKQIGLTVSPLVGAQPAPVRLERAILKEAAPDQATASKLLKSLNY